MSATPSNDREARRAEMLARKAEREKAQAEEDERHADLLLELEDRFEAELGRKGREYAIVDLSDVGEGAVVVKRPEPAHMRTFKNSKMREADHYDLVKACLVHPDFEAFKSIAGRRDFVAVRCATAAAKLHGLKLEEDRGK